ncbi:hypothetical protein FH972_019055 [Carpinus fangiana]|uniref:Uncharacterized protein n=1 Tax=Carpinus fangiana TaxID=176857 RepID=A0A5N6RQG2_9ROSI|nr:hypothetical protein FH972_019055 [Carpinus fangiana]
MGGRSLTFRPTGCMRSRPPQPRSHGASGGNRCELAEQAVADVGHIPGIESQSTRKVVWGSVVRNLTQLYPDSQLPEKLVSNIRRHYDSLPLRFGVVAEA